MEISLSNDSFEILPFLKNVIKTQRKHLYVFVAVFKASIYLEYWHRQLFRTYNIIFDILFRKKFDSVEIKLLFRKK